MVLCIYWLQYIVLLWLYFTAVNCLQHCPLITECLFHYCIFITHERAWLRIFWWGRGSGWWGEGWSWYFFHSILKCFFQSIQENSKSPKKDFFPTKQILNHQKMLFSKTFGDFLNFLPGQAEDSSLAISNESHRKGSALTVKLLLLSHIHEVLFLVSTFKTLFSLTCNSGMGV